MRTVILGAFALAVLATSLLADDPKDPKKDEKKKVTWEKTYADALKKAQEGKKALLVFVSSDTYQASKTFQSKFFDDKKVIADCDKLVCVKVDTSQKDKTQLDKWGTKKGPEVRFFDFKENQLGEPTTALKNADELVELIDKAANYCAEMASTIEWLTSYDVALKQAKDQKKPVFIDYSMDG